MGKNIWPGHAHYYDETTVVSTNQTFAASRCGSCGEHRLMTRLKALLRIGK